MNNVKKPSIIILIFSIFLGMFMAGQFKQNTPTIAPVTLRSIQTTKDNIDTLNKEIEDLNALLKEKEEQLNVLESIASGDENIIDVLNDELEKYKNLAGFEEVEGPGVIITMQDNMAEGPFGENFNSDVIHDIDVLRIINDLRCAEAEAISVNGQRILSMSEIKCGGPIIRVNGKSLGTPFVIKAIGNPKLLSAAINAPNTYAYALKHIDQIYIELTTEDNIRIPAYNGKFNFKYAKPLKEGD
ncbi:uncharacterized protein YlxW (UPF0749 family) [Keratinibaculum paraultunense]|uniref:Uncharacterized protein YlxW (UPF0749 family) n=1 Tax=Keratinibaculum paraultunense TaxID=1278232 RepID=A0A4R3L060_9FIRM|nr:DUF881 domain-containing protein [Keratinibaculum paraultunense]QQY80542.1 DUF881 domain-containing protein [Keratinibaculum paraultunense]TCS91265.1 uncharacterized protein YlxW (UPF0749 family) [Keratinibaculum paraultunense]